MMNHMKSLVCVLALSALCVSAADLSGKWSGTFEMMRDGEKRSAGALMILKQEGGKISGSVGPSAEQQFPIKIGTIEESRVHLEVVPDQGPAVVKFELTLDGDDHLSGDLSGEGGEGNFKGKIDLKRDK
jgi:hypothetical protein